MTCYETATSLIDYSTSTINRKRIISSIEIGLGIMLIILGIGTATCEVNESMEKENE